MRRVAAAAVLVLAGLSCVAPAARAAATGAAPATTQLPRGVRPTHYDLTLMPDAKSASFSGHVTIAIDVARPTRRITLNAADLDFKAATLASGTAAQLRGEAAAPVAAVPQIGIDAPAQTATFTFDRPIARGSYLLTLDYTGRIGRQTFGLFVIDYETTVGQERALYTQFENAEARRVFPCWDEPAYKATFELEAVVPSGQMAVSNMPVALERELGDGRKRVRFAPSPQMSTYLLFFASGDFDRAVTRVGSTELGVITRRGALSQAAFVLDASATLLRLYNDYFAVPYPLPKLDNVASPGSSQTFDAMENWGAIFNFERAMLLDPSIATETTRQRVFTVVAHEMAHQWFGDLVTMLWWDDLWLNEGFASWLETRATERIHPEWNAQLDAVEGREDAMARDALASTHPIVQHVVSAEAANQTFDSITYQKGEAVIRMLEGYVGADAWRAGVRRYIAQHAYGSTVSDDLWRAVEAAAGKPVMAIAHDFTLQPGVPLIRVTQSACIDGRTTLELAQGEFSKDRPQKKALRWRVPVIAASLAAAAPVRQLVSGGKATLSVSGCGPVIVNAGQSGYFRTLYGPAQFAALAAQFAAVAPIDQLGMLSDSWSLSLAGLQPVSDVLDLANAVPADADPKVTGQVAAILDGLNDYYYAGDPERRARFRRYAAPRLSPALARIGWARQAGEASAVGILREQLIGTLSALGDPGVIAEARRRYAARGSDPAAVPAELRLAITGVVARHADAQAWDELRAAANAEKSPLVRDKLYFLLGSTEDEGLARRALDLALTPEPGATMTASMIQAVAQLHPELAFDFALARLDTVNAALEAPARTRFIARLAQPSLEPAMIGKLKTYADEHLPADTRLDAESAMAIMAYRIGVRRERLPAVDAWLAPRPD
jgi:aminopeptidase N